MKLLLIITLITLIGITLWIYNNETSYTPNQVNRVYRIEDIGKKSTILLHKRESQGDIYSFFVYITGNIDGKARLTLDYQDSSNNPQRSEDVSGEVAIKWGGDWYADKLKIEYEPLSDITNGSLSLEYDFDAM